MRLDEARDFWRSRGVPEEAIEDLWTLAEAARYNDAQAEERDDIRRLLTECGWNPDAVEYMAEQRALRAMMVITPGGADALREFARKFEPGLVRSVDQGLLPVLAMTWMDGFANAARAQGLRELGPPNEEETDGEG